jgi:hypothetical protein
VLLPDQGEIGGGKQTSELYQATVLRSKGWQAVRFRDALTRPTALP